MFKRLKEIMVKEAMEDTMIPHQTENIIKEILSKRKEILQLKSTIIEIKISLKKLNSRLE